MKKLLLVSLVLAALFAGCSDNESTKTPERHLDQLQLGLESKGYSTDYLASEEGIDKDSKALEILEVQGNNLQEDAFVYYYDEKQADDLEESDFEGEVYLDGKVVYEGQSKKEAKQLRKKARAPAF